MSRTAARCRWMAGLVAFALPVMAADLLTAAPDQAPAQQELEEILVRGEQPGPAMWKVSNGDHTLWIMGTLSPMPGKMTWRQRQAEEVIKASGEILAESSTDFDMDIGLREGFSLLRQAMKLRHNADGSTLKQVLPAPVYQRWHAAHRRWFGKDPGPKERARPFYAAVLLYERALERSGLTPEPVVWNTAAKVARRHGVKVRRREFRMELKDPRGMLDELAKLPVEQEAACLVAVLDYIDQEVPKMKRRAEAWAVGDLAELRRLPSVRDQPACMELAKGTRVAELARREEELHKEDWAGIVDWLLLTHPTSFTTLPVEKLFEPDGVLADLRRKGYTVEEPR